MAFVPESSETILKPWSNHMRTGDKSQKTEGRNLGRGTPVASRTHRPNPEILTRRPETETRAICAFLGAQGDCAVQLHDGDTSVGPSVPTGHTPSACCSRHHEAPQFPSKEGLTTQQHGGPSPGTLQLPGLQTRPRCRRLPAQNHSLPRVSQAGAEDWPLWAQHGTTAKGVPSRNAPTTACRTPKISCTRACSPPFGDLGP